MDKKFGGRAFGARIGARAGGLGLALLASTAICALPAAVSQARAQQTTAISYSIPAGSLGSAISRFGDRSNLQVLYAANLVRGKRSPGVSGNLTREQALSRLLADTGLAYRFTNANTVTIINPTSSAGGTVAANGTTVLETINVQGTTETATSPVNGYVANVSGVGTKTNASIIETPQSISVVGTKQIKDQSIQNVKDALAYTPSVFAEAGGQVTSGSDGYFLRGYSYSNEYLDGMLSNAWQEPYGLERVEVLRGPASVLYGESAPGGLVNTVSKRPTEEPLHEVGVTTTSYGGAEGFFDFSGKIDKEGHFLYRLTGLGKNLATQFDNGTRYQRVFIAPAITWRPDADTKLTVLAKYQYDPRLLQTPFVNYAGSITRRYDGFHFPTDWYASDPAFEKPSYRRTYQIGYEFDHNFNDVWSIHQRLRYEQTQLEHRYINPEIYDDSSIITRDVHRIWEKTNTFTVDTNAQAKFDTGALNHTAIFGIDYRGIRDLNKQGSGFSSDYDTSLYDPDINYSGPVPDYTSGSKQNSWQLGLYGQDQIKWDRFTFLMGGRYDWYKSNTYDLFDSSSPSTEINQHDFTYRLGLVYEFDNGIAPYASYATSFEPQSGVTSPERGSQPLKPTTGQSYEVGIKYKPSFMDALFTVAVYDTTKQNVTTTDPDNTSYSVQTGEVRTRGFEFSGTANITDNLRLISSYSYIDAKVTRTNIASQLGKSPYEVPRQEASLWLDYTFDGGALDGLGLGGGIRYVGESAVDASNSLWVPSHTVFDAALRYDFGKKWPDLKGLQLSVNAKNIFNKQYIAECTGADFACYYGEGRTFYGTLSYRW